MPDLIFVNRFFHPDHSATSQMLSDLAFALAEEGWSVHVVTSRLVYDAPAERLPARETIGGVEIHRIATTGFGRGGLIGRALDYATFYLSAARALGALARQGDFVVAKTDPPMLSVIVAPIARLRGAEQVNWLQDIFPEVATALGAGRGRLSGAIFRGLRQVRDRSLRQARANVVLGRRMAEHVGKLGVADDRVRLIPNWADGTLLRPEAHEENPLRAEWGLGDAFVVAYSGNLGRAHDHETLIEAIAETEARQATAPGATAKPRIRWLFVGGGTGYEALRREVHRRKLGSVRFEPYQSRERLSHSLSAADLHLVSLRPELEELIVPSKIYGIAAVGRPAIFIGDRDGEVARHLADYDCGATVAQGDGAGLARTVLELSADPARCRQMGDNARRAFEATFEKRHAIDEWKRLLDEIAAESRARGVPPSRSRTPRGS